MSLLRSCSVRHPFYTAGRLSVPFGTITVVPSIDAFLDLVTQLPGVERTDKARWSQFDVIGQRFGYLWEPTVTVGLKQTIAEQLALVGERPDVFEVQFTAYGFGWVGVHLERVERDELAELVFEAWRLSAPDELVEERADRLPE